MAFITMAFITKFFLKFLILFTEPTNNYLRLSVTRLRLVKIEVGHGRGESSFRLWQLVVEHLSILCMWSVLVHVCAIHLRLNFQ